ncbi:unnamed protein product [Plutella xylostella]|uniref:(diamondback moth) hypothetical protein n=1 Tax=Plutella xylostella TaxID=51655 RepID=A0A8S4E3D4_PLUXY|nr:unnamed protein product [Plutella xylostella]
MGAQTTKQKYRWSCQDCQLKEVAERWNRYGTGAGSSALSQLRGVRAVAAGPAHVACLLEDGTICRAAFSIIPDRLDLSKADASKGGGMEAVAAAAAALAGASRAAAAAAAAAPGSSPGLGPGL